MTVTFVKHSVWLVKLCHAGLYIWKWWENQQIMGIGF